MSTWQTTRFCIDLSRPQVMGILNVTPDSFSDGGRHASTLAALRHAEHLLKEGADILDIGGESTRPGAPTVSAEEEWRRLEGVLRACLGMGVPISVDTFKSETMQRALDLGVDIINDVQALSGPGALDVVSAHGRCGVCLMHMKGSPADMQDQAVYDDVLEQVAAFLRQRLEEVGSAGLAPERVVLDPGIGFGKTPEHNLALLRRQASLKALGRPLLLGWSRKSTLGHLTGRDVEGRLPASLAAALACIQQGASIVRVHDVGATVDALKVWQAAGLLDEPQKSVTIA